MNENLCFSIATTCPKCTAAADIHGPSCSAEKEGAHKSMSLLNMMTFPLQSVVV